MTKKILVLMSAFNGQSFIESQIESIMKQETSYKVVLRIRDDGSSDNTQNIIKQLQNKYPNRIEYFYSDNIGSNAGFLFLLREASGYDYYAISDQDDVWLPNKLSVACKYLEAENDSLPLLYASTSYLVADDLKPYGKTREKTRDFSIFNTIIQNICPGHTLLPGRRKYFFGILILIIVISVSLLFLPKPLFERLKISFLKSDDSFTNRLMAWEIATDSIKGNMFFGKSNYGAFFKNYVKENSIELSKKYPGIAHSILYDTHNLLLGLVFKYGLIGFFIILFCSGYYIYVFRKSDYSILFLSIFVYTFISGIGSYYFDHTIGITSIFIPMGMNMTLKRECSAISKDIDTIKLIM